MIEIFTGKKVKPSDHFKDISDLEESEKLNIAKGGEDIPELETEKEAEERQRVKQRQKEAEEKH